MKTWKQQTWQQETVSVDGNCRLFGVNIFDYEWIDTGKKATVREPNSNKTRSYDIFQVIINGEKHEFAAGELSNCVWGFYLLHY
jgi:hypothetical protein